MAKPALTVEKKILRCRASVRVDCTTFELHKQANKPLLSEDMPATKKLLCFTWEQTTEIGDRPALPPEHPSLKMVDINLCRQSPDLHMPSSVQSKYARDGKTALCEERGNRAVGGTSLR
jgi:hypothetical protein